MVTAKPFESRTVSWAIITVWVTVTVPAQPKLTAPPPTRAAWRSAWVQLVTVPPPQAERAKARTAAGTRRSERAGSMREEKDFMATDYSSIDYNDYLPRTGVRTTRPLHGVNDGNNEVTETTKRATARAPPTFPAHASLRWRKRRTTCFREGIVDTASMKSDQANPGWLRTFWP